MLLSAGTSQAQRSATPPSGVKKQPDKESKAAPLPAKQLEEALQLLLKATEDSAQTNQRRRFRATEVEGLVMDQTITKVGRDFYDVFYGQWDPPADVGEYTVIVREKPGRANNILISLEVNENELLEFPLQPRYDLIEDAATEAVGIALNFLLSSRNNSQQLERGDNKTSIEVY